MPTGPNPADDGDLVDRVEAILFDLKRHPIALDATFKSVADLGLSPDELSDYDTTARAQAQERVARMHPRRTAVASLVGELRELWPRVEPLLRRAIDNPSDTEWLCVQDNVATKGTALQRVCDWACSNCCDAALAELKLIRDWRHGFDQPRHNPVLFTQDGRPREPVGRFYESLPDAAEAAQPRSLQTIAKAVGLGHDTVRSFSSELRREGYVELDGKKVWRRKRPLT